MYTNFLGLTLGIPFHSLFSYEKVYMFKLAPFNKAWQKLMYTFTNMVHKANVYIIFLAEQ